MDIVLGVSMTPTTVRMVLVEGEKADGVTVDHDVFDVTSVDGSANVDAPSRSSPRFWAPRRARPTGGHHLKSIGVTWSDHTEASALRDALDRARHRRRHARLRDARCRVAGAGRRPCGRLRHHRAAVRRARHRHAVGGAAPTTARWSRCSAAPCTAPTRWPCSPRWPAPWRPRTSPPQGLFVVGSGVDVSLGQGPPRAPGRPARQRARRRRDSRWPAAPPSPRPPRRASRPPPSAWRIRRTPTARRLARSTPAWPVADTQLAAAEADEVVDEFAPTEMRDDRRGSQALPARRQRADLRLRHRRRRARHLARRQHQADRRSAAQPGADRRRAEQPGARSRPRSSRQLATAAPPSARDHQAAGARGAGDAAAGAAAGVRRTGSTRAGARRRSGPRARRSCAGTGPGRTRRR